MMRARRLLRIAGAELLSWYLILLAFTFYPYCHPGWEREGAVCYIGQTDFGWLYHDVYWASFMALPFAGAVLIVWALSEVAAWVRRRHAA